MCLGHSVCVGADPLWGEGGAALPEDSAHHGQVGQQDQERRVPAGDADAAPAGIAATSA